MRLIFACFFTVNSFVFSFGIAHPNGPILFDNRGQEADPFNKICIFLGCTKGKSETIEFANTNTFVRMKTAVVGQDVYIHLPSTLTPDQLMEALIKIRTAKTLGARSVSVVSTSNLNSILVKYSGLKSDLLKLNIEQFLRVAGADYSIELSLVEQKLIRNSLDSVFLNKENKLVKEIYVVGRHHRHLAQDIARKLGLPYRSFEEVRTGRNKHIIFVAPASAPVNENLFQILSNVERWKKQGAQVTLVSPYLPYARSDKVDQPGVTVTGRLAADLIEAAGTDSMVFVRAHAPQSQGFFSIHTLQVSSHDTINKKLRSLGVEQIISPDGGFLKSATLYAEALNLPLGGINKQRDVLTGEIKLLGLSGPSPKNRIVAVIDDETVSGRTLAEAAKFLVEEHGAKSVIAVVTHLAGKPKAALQSPFISQFIVTNSLPVKKSKREPFDVLSLADEMSDILRPLVQEQGSQIRFDCKTALE